MNLSREMEKTSSIYVAGHNGMVGSAIVRKLKEEGYTNILVRSSSELDLRKQPATDAFFREYQPEFIFLAAAHVGGIAANDTYRADFIYDNLMIEANTIHAAYLHKATKLLFLGSSCIYPRLAPQPLKEEYMLSGYLEPTNQPYAIAKIAGIEMCDAYRRQHGCNFISIMPSNLYGPNDNFDLATSHVLPALLRRIMTARNNNDPEVVIWGTGSPRREFLHVDDMAAACIFLMQNYNGAEIVNAGVGKDISILELAGLISEIVGYDGKISCDASRPDGTPRKLMDISRIRALGWQPAIGLREGIEQLYHALSNTAWEQRIR
jgi:GDP-L-fucose synthase